MASGEERLPIGEPVPRGVVDVAHQTIGVPDQSANLRRQIEALRTDLSMLEERLRHRGRRLRSSEGVLVSGPVLSSGRLLGATYYPFRPWIYPTARRAIQARLDVGPTEPISPAMKYEPTERGETRWICIVGDGPVGLSIAIKLESSGLSVTLIEAEEEDGAPLGEMIVSNGNHGFPDRTCRPGIGGGSALGGGRCVEFDDLNFEVRDHVAMSGWPIRHEESSIRQRTASIRSVLP